MGADRDWDRESDCSVSRDSEIERVVVGTGAYVRRSGRSDALESEAPRNRRRASSKKFLYYMSV